MRLDQILRLVHRRAPSIRCLLCPDTGVAYALKPDTVSPIKRNLERFPGDFMFQLDRSEAAALRSQIATSNVGRGGRRYAPYVFTEQGVAMLSGVLRSKRAVAVNIEIMRAFVELRRVASSYAAIETRLEQIEQELGGHDEH
jgi:hypothetical protein